jgi:hypothetical protein
MVQHVSIKTHNKMFYMSERTPSERGDLKIFPNGAHMLWFAGLRGAVAYACVWNFPDTYGNRDSFTMTTMMIVLVTIFGMGATTARVLTFLDIETDVCEDAYMNTWSMERAMPDFIVKIEQFIQNRVHKECEEDDGVFIAGSESENMSENVPDVNSSFHRRSSITLTKSVRWETSGIYDFGMD